MLTNQVKGEAEGKQGELSKDGGRRYRKRKEWSDKPFILYMLREAWKQVKSNNGVLGVDGISVAHVERLGVEDHLQTLGEEIRKQTYQPGVVKRVMIPKANGGERPLGVPAVKDRIAQTVPKMILEPIFEADSEESSYCCRLGKSSKDAIFQPQEPKEVRAL